MTTVRTSKLNNDILSLTNYKCNCLACMIIYYIIAHTHTHLMMETDRVSKVSMFYIYPRQWMLASSWRWSCAQVTKSSCCSKTGFQELIQQPYSPDPVSSDYFLFWNLRKHLYGCVFSSNGEPESALRSKKQASVFQGFHLCLWNIENVPYSRKAILRSRKNASFSDVMAIYEGESVNR
jgi:hypothetical protein